jgi:hypothetical protein
MSFYTMLSSTRRYGVSIWLSSLSFYARKAMAEETDDLENVINPRFSSFLDWVQLSMKGEANYEDLDTLKDSYLSGSPDTF